MADSKSFLRQIYPIDTNDAEAEVDVIAVHGLDPLANPLHAIHTWSAVNGNLWLRDFLPERNPRIRVLLYGYNSSAAFHTSATGINGAAENLLSYLRLERQQDQERPIVWVSHSLGGLVVKRAIINAYITGDYYESIHDATRGVVFFGTPHRGGHLATLGDRMAKICRAVSGNVRNDIMEALRTDSMFAGDLNKDFARRAKALELRVLNFIENLPIASHAGLVVPPSSAALDWPEPAEIQVRLEATHTGICKFGEKNDTYRRVEDHISELLTWSSNNATASIEQVERLSRHSHDTEAPPLTITNSTESLSGGVVEEYNSTWLPTQRSNSSTWLDKLAGLWPLSNRSSFTSSDTKSTKSNGAAESMAEWPICMLPHPRPESTIERAQLFERLLVASGAGPVALHGIGGAGKTQLAVKLAYWFLDRHPESEFSVIWIHAASVETCAEGLRTLAEKCRIVYPRGKTISDQRSLRASLAELVRSVRTWFERAPARKWLFIFDSADEVDVLVAPLVDLEFSLESDDVHRTSIIDCVPADGYVVFTTKSRAAAARFSDGSMLEVGRFTLKEATHMLEVSVDATLLIDKPTAPQQRSLMPDFGKVPHEDKTDRASELAEKLDCLPLALSQAAAFMNKNRLPIADYLKRISAPSDEMVAELMTLPQPLEAQIGVPKSIYETWKLSYEAIRSHNSLAADALALMSFLEQNSIILDLLKAVLCTGPDVRLVGALGELRDYGLIDSGFVTDTFTIHRLVQATTKKWLKESKLDVQWAQVALMTIADKFPNPENIPSWSECAAWLPHAIKILQDPLLKTSAADKAALATLHLKVGQYYFQTGRYSEARASTEIACDIRTDILGPLEPRTLEARDQFIEIVRQLGLYNLAEATARNVKRYRKRKLGMKNELTLQSYTRLSQTLQDQGQVADALRYAEKALKGFQDLHGATDPPHPDILVCKYRSGALYDLMGDYSKSEALLSEALEGMNQQGQGETRHASLVLYRLAYLQRSLGDYRKSEESAFASMEMRRKMLGWDHPDTAKAYFNVGWSMQCQGRYKESADIFTTVMEVSKKIVGERHAYTFIASYFLAESLKGLGELKEAKELHDRVLAGRKKVLRKNHPDVLTSQVSLASVLHLLGDSKLAEELTLEVYTFLKKEGTISKERAGIAWMCMSNMGKIYAERAESARSESEKQKRWKEAIKWGERLVESQKPVIGSRHPEAIKASQELTGYMYAFANVQTTISSILGMAANMKF